MKVVDSRRLTGLNLQGPGPGAVCDVAFEPNEDAAEAIKRWSEAIDRIFEALNWMRTERWIRCHSTGASLLIDAPIDALYAATEINEWAVATAGGNGCSVAEMVARAQASLETEANPALVGLQRAAMRHNVPFVWDDDAVSVGLGRRSATWPTNELPEPTAIDWGAVGTIPFAYITGTNGKTTTTRMLMSIAAAAGISHGGTSSDGVVINGVEVERGDWTGPGAARRVLRDRAVDLAVLETARGGLLRRGLVLDHCDAAAITNIAHDHLGEYGIHTLDDLTEAKGIVCKAVREDGHRVLNADDPNLWSLGQTPGPAVIWVSLDSSATLLHALASGQRGWARNGSTVVRWLHGRAETVMAVDAIPAAHGGHAAHNLANAMTAAALADALELPLAAIRAGLMSFGSTDQDNPGRCNVVEHHGVQFLLDFGHNPHGVRAALSLADSLRSQTNGRLAVTVGQAGDRPDDALRSLADAVHAVNPDRVCVREIPGYERGRADGEVSAIIQTELLRLGQTPSAITLHPNELDAMRSLLDWVRPRDVVAHLIYLDRNEVRALIADWSASTNGGNVTS